MQSNSMSTRCLYAMFVFFLAAASATVMSWYFHSKILVIIQIVLSIITIVLSVIFFAMTIIEKMKKTREMEGLKKALEKL